MPRFTISLHRIEDDGRTSDALLDGGYERGELLAALASVLDSARPGDAFDMTIELPR